MSENKFFKNNALVKANYVEVSESDRYLIPTEKIEMLINAERYNFTANEYKLLNTIFYKAQHKALIDKEYLNKDYTIDGYRVAELSFDNFKDIFKVTNEVTLQNFYNTVMKFTRVQIILKTKKYKLVTSLLPKIVVEDQGHKIICCVDNDVYNVLESYKEGGYTPLDIKLLRKAKGMYTQILYENFRMWAGFCSIKKISLDELKSILNVEGILSYEKYGQFKRRVLSVAIKEINEKLNMIVTMEEHKTGASVTHITFTIIDREPRKYEFKKTKKIDLSNNITTKDYASNEINSIDYMNLIDLQLNESIHNKFLEDFENYREYIIAVETASKNTLSAISGKTINTRNYKYFKTTLENLIPNISI